MRNVVFAFGLGGEAGITEPFCEAGNLVVGSDGVKPPPFPVLLAG